MLLKTTEIFHDGITATHPSKDLGGSPSGGSQLDLSDFEPCYLRPISRVNVWREQIFECILMVAPVISIGDVFLSQSHADGRDRVLEKL